MNARVRPEGVPVDKDARRRPEYVTNVLIQEGADQLGKELFALADNAGNRIASVANGLTSFSGVTKRRGSLRVSSTLIGLAVSSRDFYDLATTPNGDRFAVTGSQSLYRQTGGVGNFAAVPGVTLPAAARSLAATPAGDIIVPCYSGAVVRIPGGTGAPVVIDATSRVHWGCAVDSAGGVYIAVFGGGILKGTVDGGFSTISGALVRNWRGVDVIANGVSFNVFAVAYGDLLFKQTAGAGEFLQCGDAIQRYWTGIAATRGGDLYLSTSNGANGSLLLQAQAAGAFIDIGMGDKLWSGGCVSSAGVVSVGVHNGDVYSNAGGLSYEVIPGTDMASEYVVLASSLIGNASLKIRTESALTGQIVRIVRKDRSANTLAIVNGGAGAGTLITLPAAPTANIAVDLKFDGTNWALLFVEYLY